MMKGDPTQAPPPADKDWHEERAAPGVSRPVVDTLRNCFVNGLPQLDAIRDHFRDEGRLREEDALQILQQSTKVLRSEPNLLQLQDPICVVGDLHGQYYDLLKLLDIAGPPGDTQYLFLGDYVDRGCFSMECALLLLAMKIVHPKRVTMLRGNHECRHLTAFFNFKQECLYKYSSKVYDAMMLCFDALPLAAVLNGRFLCVHGGLSPDIRTLDDIQRITRFIEPPPSGPLCDLIWSDPMDDEEIEANPTAKFVENELRGCSYMFSYEAAKEFLHANNLLSIIRAHEAQDSGYRLYRTDEKTAFPTVICIFSAPNYCDSYNNKAAVLLFKNNLLNIRQFTSQPHPYYLPNFMNAFEWSLPFVQEKVTDLLYTIWHLCDDAEDDKNLDKSGEIQNKIKNIGMMAQMYKQLREQADARVQLGNLISGGNMDLEQIMQMVDLESGVLDAKKIDKLNETRPCDRPR